MGRPPLEIGQHGSVKFTRDGDHWVARCRFRDLDGTTRRLERRGRSRTAARTELHAELHRRVGAHTRRLRPNCRFRDAADVWLTVIAERRADATIRTYAHWLDTVVLPHLGELRLSELDTAHVAEFFCGLERDGRTATDQPRYSASTRRTIRSVVNGILQRAVLDGAIPANPIRR